MDASEQTVKAVAEMRRSPDAHMALELIEQLTTDPNVRAVIDAYFEALED
jgi:hypothetical protein